MTLYNDDIPIKAQLELEETNKYLRAYVYDKDLAAISGSPFSLTHVSGGLYQKIGVAMPDSTSVTVKILVYDDAGFTTRTSHYPPIIQTFEKTSAGYQIYNTSDIALELDESSEIDLNIDTDNYDVSLEET